MYLENRDKRILTTKNYKIMKAVVKNVGIFVAGIAAKVVFDYGYKKTKKCLNNRKKAE